MKSIYLRNFIVTATTIFIGLLLLVVSLVAIGQNYILEDYRVNMSQSVKEVARTAYAVSESETLDSWFLGMNLSSVSKATGNQIFVTDADGKIVSCSDASPVCSHMGLSISKSIIEKIDDSGSYNGQSNLDGLYDEERMIVAEPILNEKTGDYIGYVFASVLKSEILSTWTSFLWIIIVVFLAIFIGLLIFSFWYSKHMSQPLDEIAEASRHFARGDFSVRVKQNEDPSNEMGALIESFNTMADSLENSEKRRTEFISNISHELRTPMTTIAGFADGILDGTIPKEQEQKYLITIRDETRRLSRLVREMLDVSKMKSNAGDPEKRSNFDLNELILQVLLSFESRATKKGLDVDLHFPDESILVNADKDGITQVIYNLLDNAFKFASPDTIITLGISKQNSKAFISVKDEGETIPPDDLPYIFDRFHKSDRSRSLDKEGVGLGLYLVKTIINAHDEDIAVKSENGITEFVFTLPVTELGK